MIKDFFHKNRKPLTELIPETTRELGKSYSRIELATSKLGRRDKELFDACSFYLRKGSKERATIYANEIVEIRKVLSILQHTELVVEQAILRLDTLKTVTPTFESLQAVFGDVRTALGLITTVMPSISPEIDKLNAVVGEILEDTKLDLTMPEPLVTSDSTTEAILQEAATVVEQEMKVKIPEPPIEIEIPKPPRLTRPLVALTTVGSKTEIGEVGTIFRNDDSIETFDVSSFLLEELVMDYIERNRGDMNIARCSRELNLPRERVSEALGSLSNKGKIAIVQ